MASRGPVEGVVCLPILSEHIYFKAAELDWQLTGLRRSLVALGLVHEMQHRLCHFRYSTRNRDRSAAVEQAMAIAGKLLSISMSLMTSISPVTASSTLMHVDVLLRFVPMFSACFQGRPRVAPAPSAWFLSHPLHCHRRFQLHGPCKWLLRGFSFDFCCLKHVGTYFPRLCSHYGCPKPSSAFSPLLAGACLQ